MARVNPFRLVATAAVCLVSSFAFYACSSDGLPPTAIEDEAEQESATSSTASAVSIELAPARASLAIGASVRIEATVYGSGDQVLANQAVQFRTGDASIADVTGDGIVTARATGNTVITAESGGVSGTVAISVVAAGDPTVSISAPADRTRHAQGATISFEGTADDAEDGPLTGAALVWTSDRDGFLGEGSPLGVNTLSLGDHTITLTATDADGGTGSASIRIAIFRNGPPTVAITAPADGAVYKQGDPIDFMGVGSDPEDGSLVGSSLEWSSDLDGPLGTGANITISNLSVGDHVITLTGTDSRGVSATAHIDVTVTPAKVGETPIVQILDPGDRTIHQAGQVIDFVARAFDPEDGNLTGASVVWTSDKDGVIGTGNPLSTSALTLGDHSITVTATDSDGNSKTSKAIRIAVVGAAPQKIWVRAGSGTSISVQEGSGLGIPIHVDMSMANGADLASLTFEVTWDPQVLDYNSAAPGTFGSVTFNETGVDNGILVVSLFNATGTTSSFDAVTIDYTAASAGMTDVTPTPTAAGDENGNDIIGIVMGDDLDVTVTPVSQPMDPMADAGPDQTVTDADNSGDEPVTLDGSGSSDSDGTIVSYVWSEGGQQIATGVNPTVNLSVGPHTITLTVTDDDGLMDMDDVDVTVLQGMMAPDADAGPDQTVTDADNSGDEPVTLDGSGSSDSDGTIVSYVWSEGGQQIATGVNPTVNLSVGPHTITLTVTDDDGLMDTDDVDVTVLQGMMAPDADAGPDQTVTDADNSGDEPVTLDGSGSSDSDGTIASYVWSEGGQQIATGVNPTVNLSVGPHTITLTVTDDDGLMDTDDVDVTVLQGMIAPDADAGPDQTVTDADNSGDEPVTLDGSGSSDSDGTIASYVWSEGGQQIATGVNPTVNLSVGPHTITLTVTDDDGLMDTDDVDVTVLQGMIAPDADAGPDQTVTDTDNSGDEPVTLDGSGSSDSDGTIASYVWSEGGQQIATGVNPTVNLSVGPHTITLTVTDDDGLMDTDDVDVTVLQGMIAPDADAGPDQTVTDTDNSGDEPVTLDGSGSSDSDGTIASYVWSEGGQQIATGVNPTVNLSVGPHTITLTVTDDDGLMGTDDVDVTVLQGMIAPDADAGPDQTVTDTDNSGDEPVTLDGSGSSDSDGTIASYVWSEGGQQIATGVNPTVNLSVGPHTITLTVTDDDGLMDTDDVDVTVQPGITPKEIVLSAGDGSLTSVPPGQQFTLPIPLDMSNAGGTLLGSVSFRVTWDAALMTLTPSDPRFPAGPGTCGSITVNPNTPGELFIAFFDGFGLGSSCVMANPEFTAGSSPGTVTITPVLVNAGDELGQDISGIIRTVPLDLIIN